MLTRHHNTYEYPNGPAVHPTLPAIKVLRGTGAEILKLGESERQDPKHCFFLILH